MPLFFDPLWLILVGPALLLGLWAQWRVHSAYGRAQRMPAPLSGAAAARHVLNQAGLQDVAIEQVGGMLSDHYDPRHKVLRLSNAVYNSRSLAAVGIAAHEAGHAIQDARGYAPLVVRNAAVPLAGFGSGIGVLLFFIGMVLMAMRVAFGDTIALVGLVLFGAVVFFQIVNLPVEFNASSRAKEQLVALGIVDSEGMVYVNQVLNAAALTYVAATLQAIMQLLYFALIFTRGSSRN
jgi:Zn-dependent membrane protease YugP